jgi:hypothetical protein
MVLPNRVRAVVVPAKVRDYLLSHEHAVGRFKAVVFETTGFPRDSWEVLHADLLAVAGADGAVLKMTGLHGRKYEVPAILKGPAGRELSVLTVWLVRRSEDFPRFITAYPRARRWGSRSWILLF